MADRSSTYENLNSGGNMKEKLCEKCKKNPASKPHICPFAEEVYDDSTTKCTCCDDCTQECADDI